MRVAEGKTPTSRVGRSAPKAGVRPSPSVASTALSTASSAAAAAVAIVKAVVAAVAPSPRARKARGREGADDAPLAARRRLGEDGSYSKDLGLGWTGADWAPPDESGDGAFERL